MPSGVWARQLQLSFFKGICGAGPAKRDHPEYAQ